MKETVTEIYLIRNCNNNIQCHNTNTEARNCQSADQKLAVCMNLPGRYHLVCAVFKTMLSGYCHENCGLFYVNTHLHIQSLSLSFNIFVCTIFFCRFPPGGGGDSHMGGGGLPYETDGDARRLA